MRDYSRLTALVKVFKTMIEETHENPDSTTGAEEVETSEDTTTEDVSKDEDTSEGSSKETDALKKAENRIVALKKEKKDLEKELKSQKPEVSDENLEKTQSNEPDYAKIAFLKGEGVKHPDDQKYVQEEAERLKMPLTDILQMEHVKNKMRDDQNQRNAQENMPDKGGRGGKTQQDVDYWVQKGELPKDQELAEKVVNAKIAKDDSRQMFDPLE